MTYGQGTGFPIVGSRVRNHWLAPSLTSTVNEMSTRYSWRISGKNKLSLCSGFVALSELNPIHKLFLEQ